MVERWLTVLKVTWSNPIGDIAFFRDKIYSTVIYENNILWCSCGKEYHYVSVVYQQRYKSNKKTTIKGSCNLFRSKIFAFVLKKQPIRTLYTIYPVFWLDDLGVWICSSYSKVDCKPVIKSDFSGNKNEKQNIPHCRYSSKI